MSNRKRNQGTVATYLDSIRNGQVRLLSLDHVEHLSNIGVNTHAQIDDHISDLSGDDHSQYVLLAGRSSGQIIIGGTAAGEDLTLQSTSDATSGHIFFGGSQSSAYDETNDRLGIGIASPDQTLHVHKGSAGTITTHSSSPLTVENSGDCYIQVLSPATNIGGIFFGDTGSATVGRVIYNHSTDTLSLYAGSSKRVNITSTNTEINGDLTVNTGQIAFSDGTYTKDSLWSHNGGVNGLGLVLSAGHEVIIHAGEETLVGAGLNTNAEDLHLAANGSMYFWTGTNSAAAGDKAMTIDSAGNIGVATAPNVNAKLTINGDLYVGGESIFWNLAANNDYIAYSDTAFIGSGGGVTFFADHANITDTTPGSSPKGHVAGGYLYARVRLNVNTTSTSYTVNVTGDAGKTTGTLWINTSDERIKKDIKPITGALDKFKNLTPSTFGYKDFWVDKHEGLSADKRYCHFIAQDYQKQFPEYIHENEDGYLEVDAHAALIHSFAAIKELSELVDGLKSEIKELKVNQATE